MQGCTMSYHSTFSSCCCRQHRHGISFRRNFHRLFLWYSISQSSNCLRFISHSQQRISFPTAASASATATEKPRDQFPSQQPHHPTSSAAPLFSSLQSHHREKFPSHQLPLVEYILQFLHREGIDAQVFLSRHQWNQLHQELERIVHKRIPENEQQATNLSSSSASFSLQNTKKLFKRLRLVLQMKPELREHRELVRNCLTEKMQQQHSGEGDVSILSLSYQLQSHLPLPRNQIYSLLLKEVRRLQRKNITREQRDFVKQFVKQHFVKMEGEDESKHEECIQDTTEFSTVEHTLESDFSITEMCDKLQQEMQVPRVLLYALVLTEVEKIRKRNVSEDERMLIRHYIDNMLRSSSANTSQESTRDITNEANRFTDALINRVNVPRAQLLRVVKSELNRQQPQKRIRTAKHRKIVQEYVQQLHMDTMSSSKSVAAICDELKTQEHLSELSRPQLYKLVQNELQKYERKTIKMEHLDKIHEAIQREKDQNGAPLDIPLLCNKLEKETKLPRSLLYETIRKQVDKLKRKSITPEQKRLVRQFIIDSSDPLPQMDRISLYCDQLEGKVDIPRTQLYKVVATEIHKLLRRPVSQEQRQRVREYVAEHWSTMSVLLICDALQKELELPRKQLYDMIHRECAKQKRASSE